MKKLLALALMLPLLALADPIPPKLGSHIRIFQVDETTLVDGVLRVRSSRSVVTQEIYRTLVKATCMPLWLDDKKDGWAKARIERVEVVNQIGAQGYAFVGGRKACAALGQVSGGPDNENKFIAANTWVCVAGNPCRPRREGERTSGDE